MKISTKGRYALRIMVELAQHDKDVYVSLKEISEHQGVSVKYLETIASILHKAGFVTSLRGKGGGYKLAGAPGGYTVGSVLKLMEGSLAPVACLEPKTNKCSRAGQCVTLPVWRKLDHIIDEYVESVTIEDMIMQKRAMAGYDYSI